MIQGRSDHANSIRYPNAYGLVVCTGVVYTRLVRNWIQRRRGRSRSRPRGELRNSLAVSVVSTCRKFTRDEMNERDIPHMKNITFSADENKIQLAREVARSEHKTLNDAFRDWLDWYASRKVTRAEIEALFERLKYADAGRKFTRDEMNER